MTVVAIIGLGYVGLPLALEFGKKHKTIGFDIDTNKIDCYKRKFDPNNEFESTAFDVAKQLTLTSDDNLLTQAEVIIVTVPTPVDNANNPDFGPLVTACKLVGKNLQTGSTVVFESTVYPGATEEICIPILENASHLKWQQDFNVAYSPERINPGDKIHNLKTIVKVVAGDTNKTLEKITELYQSIIPAGICQASSIKVAEAAKVIENAQRDINVAFVNELSILFHKIGIDTMEVLNVAKSKWNFLAFTPGLVGGHCIGVDPYYLTYKAKMLNYTPQIILAGRRINEGMGKYVAENIVKTMIKNKISAIDSKVIILGLSFKENCSDIRNSKVVDIINELKSYSINIAVCDPLANSEQCYQEYGLELFDWSDLPKADACVLATAHNFFVEKDVEEFCKLLNPRACFFDIKSVVDKSALEQKGIVVWRL